MWCVTSTGHATVRKKPNSNCMGALLVVLGEKMSVCPAQTCTLLQPGLHAGSGSDMLNLHW